MTNKKKKNILISVLGFLLILIGVGYSILSSTLSINTTSRVTGTWDIIMSFTIKEKSNDVNYSTPILNEDRISANLNTNFKLPGDYIIYTVKLENKSNVPALLKDIIVSGDNTYYNVSNTFLKNTKLNVNEYYEFDIAISLKEELEELPTSSVNHKVILKVEQTTETTPGTDEDTQVHSYNTSLKDIYSININDLPREDFYYEFIEYVPVEGNNDYEINSYTISFSAEMNELGVSYGGAYYGPDSNYANSIGSTKMTHSSTVGFSFDFDNSIMDGSYDSSAITFNNYYVLNSINDWSVKNLNQDDLNKLSVFINIEENE